MTVQDEFKCRSSDGLDWPRPYAGWERLDKSYKDFCESVQPPADTANWQRDGSYNEGTIEEHKYKVSLSDGASQFNQNECFGSLKKLIFSCDTDTGVNGRCMDNQNVVAKSAGGHFHKYKEDGGSYDDGGCIEE